ncbi:MAG: outer membrane protein assembly factor BamE [Alphaproteobacteria bacterium]|nr:outer membrane protein assembly factor BamE [Alphaproteobacteria bacterium]
MPSAITSIVAPCVALAVAFVLGACQPVVHVRGHILDDDAVASLEPGATTRDDVLDSLGSPSSVNAFGSETWYYIYGRSEVFAFFKPEVLDQRVVAIAFAEDGTVKDVKRYELDDRQEIEPVARTTPTFGKQLGLLQQLLGNLGRFNKTANGAE